jgi:hypothetical protein
MSWERLNNREPELYYNSKAKSREEITSDIKKVYERMLENKIGDSIPNPKGLLFIVHATNGYIVMVWFDGGIEECEGTWMYQLRIKDFWELSLNHKNGAFFFDQECHSAICDFMEEEIYDEEGNQKLDIFARHEIGGLKEIKL